MSEVNIPNGFRRLKVGEKILQSDIYLDGFGNWGPLPDNSMDCNNLYCPNKYRPFARKCDVVFSPRPQTRRSEIATAIQIASREKRTAHETAAIISRIIDKHQKRAKRRAKK